MKCFLGRLPLRRRSASGKSGEGKDLAIGIGKSTILLSLLRRP
jgi:hypothetical protein